MNELSYDSVPNPDLPAAEINILLQYISLNIEPLEKAADFVNILSTLAKYFNEEVQIKQLYNLHLHIDSDLITELQTFILESVSDITIEYTWDSDSKIQSLKLSKIV